MNTVKLIGNVGANPNFRVFEKNKLASFSMATSEKYLNKNATEIKNTQWHNIVAWGKVAETCEELVSKGRFISVEGKIQTRHYLNHENKRIYITEILAMKVEEVKAAAKEKVFFLETA
jgi:single-strand DNA-binding protein